MCRSGSPSNARQRSGSGARQIEQRVAIAANRLALALLSGVSPGQGLVENLLGNLHDACVSSTAFYSEGREFGAGNLVYYSLMAQNSPKVF